jgi:hypothetical protein
MDCAKMNFHWSKQLTNQSADKQTSNFRFLYSSFQDWELQIHILKECYIKQAVNCQHIKIIRYANLTSKIYCIYLSSTSTKVPVFLRQYKYQSICLKYKYKYQVLFSTYKYKYQVLFLKYKYNTFTCGTCTCPSSVYFDILKNVSLRRSYSNDVFI